MIDGGGFRSFKLFFFFFSALGYFVDGPGQMVIQGCDRPQRPKLGLIFRLFVLELSMVSMGKIIAQNFVKSYASLSNLKNIVGFYDVTLCFKTS